jgi:O-antigen biosynthesis protein
MYINEAMKHVFDNRLGALLQLAVVVSHDTNIRKHGFEVWKLWREPSGQYPSFEFDHSHGLGVLGAGPDQAAPLRRLFRVGGDREATLRVRRRFSSQAIQFNAAPKCRRGTPRSFG